jgi:hypothetical protein
MENTSNIKLEAHALIVEGSNVGEVTQKCVGTMRY